MHLYYVGARRPMLASSVQDCVLSRTSRVRQLANHLIGAAQNEPLLSEPAWASQLHSRS